MNDLIQTGFDYAALPTDIALKAQLAANSIKLRLKRTVEDIIEIGRELTAVKPSLEGTFDAWFEAETGLDRHMAYKFIQVSEKFGAVNNLPSTISPTVLYLLSAPSTPETVVQQAIEKAESGEDVSVKWVKERKQIEAQLDSERQRREAAERELHQSSVDSMAARMKINALETQIDLLKSQPTPEPIIQTVEKVIEKPVIPPEFKSLDEAIAAKKAEVERLKADAKRWEIKRDTAMANNDHAHQALRHLQRESQELEVLLSQHKSAEREMIEHKRITDALIHTCAVEIASLRVLEYAPDRAQRARWMETQQILRDAATAIQMHLDELDREHPANALEGELLEAA